MKSVFLNGKFVEPSKAVVSAFDHGFLYGDGIYETIRVHFGRPFFLLDHLRRLNASAKTIGLSIPMSQGNIVKAVEGLLRRTRYSEAVIRLTVSRGPGPYGFDTRRCKNPTVVISVSPFHGYPAAFYQRGIVGAISNVRRMSPLSLPPSAKSTNCLNGILAKMESVRWGADEAVLLGIEGEVTEGTVSNVFTVRKGVLETPALDGNLLSGVTRKWILEVAKTLGIPFRVRKLKSSDLLKADEVFFSNTLMDVLPVREMRFHHRGRIKRQTVGNGRPGPIALTLLVGFRQFMDVTCGQ